METSKTIRRMLPCPYYDVEGVESWLTDMAAEGLFLEKKGITWGIASFRRGEPRALPYRFVPNVGEPTTERVLLFDDRRGMWPETEERAMNALYGWDYVTRWKRFSIYRASEEGVRELDTDPRIQDIAVGAVQKWEILYFILLPLLLVIVPYLWTSWERLQLSFYSDPILFAISLCIEGWIVFASLARIIFLERLRKKLRQGHPLEHNKPWQQTAAVTKVIRTAGLVVLAVWITACVTSPVGLFGFRQLPYVEEYEGTLPFRSSQSWSRESWNGFNASGLLITIIIITIGLTYSIQCISCGGSLGRSPTRMEGMFTAFFTLTTMRPEPKNWLRRLPGSGSGGISRF